jgi:hypothetical protein
MTGSWAFAKYRAHLLALLSALDRDEATEKTDQ